MGLGTQRVDTGGTGAVSAPAARIPCQAPLLNGEISDFMCPKKWVGAAGILSSA